MTHKLNETSKVAVYLRKSRHDEEVDDTLAKHRNQLKEYIDTQGFTEVQWFEEIGSADSIENRPIFSALLQMIEACAFKAIIVIAYDRLTRGSQIEAGIVQETFKKSDTLILTPSRTYDLNEESDEMLSEFESVIARSEYRAIKRRMRQGKINGAKEGKMTNGKPPFPYYYDKNTRTVNLKEEDRKIYGYILKLFLEDNVSTEQIARQLNRQQIPTISRKGAWRQSQVARLLRGEFQLGFVFYNKYSRIDGKLKRNDPSKVVKVQGHHTPVKTMEQHAIIVKRFDETRLVPHRARKGEYPLSGLLKCGYCGGGLAFFTSRHEDWKYLRKCRKPIRSGKDICKENRGCRQQLVLDPLKAQMKIYRDELFELKEKDEVNTQSKDIVSVVETNVVNLEAKIERLRDLYIDGDFSKAEFTKKKEKEESKLFAAKTELGNLLQQNEMLDKVKREERTRLWEDVDLEQLFDDELSVSKKHEGFTKLIEKIYFKREGDEISLDIHYR